MSLLQAEKYFPANFKKKLVNTENRIQQITTNMTKMRQDLEEHSTMWTTMQPLYEFMYLEASADCGQYDLNLKIPPLPTDLTSVSARVKYACICIYVTIAVSHLKSVLINQYYGLALDEVATEIDKLSDVLEASNVDDFKIEDHVKNIQRVFSDEYEPDETASSSAVVVASPKSRRAPRTIIT
jgi:hypothetical protein